MRTINPPLENSGQTTSTRPRALQCCPSVVQGNGVRHGWLGIGGWLKRVREERELSRLLERDTERRRQRLREDPFGFSDVMVFVGAHRVGLLREAQGDLMAVFRDDAVTAKLDEPHGPELAARPMP